ncbi:MAG: hypothetical protein AVDCRST_MAG52-332, partial [uncultured Blastococcus sp.]
ERPDAGFGAHGVPGRGRRVPGRRRVGGLDGRRCAAGHGD